jgi:Protein of unknown function (DUF3303)
VGRYMVVEKFVQGPEPVYQRLAERGRMMPEGLTYIDSWIDETDRSRCFQLMETDDPALFDEWTSNWNDLMEYEIVPVISSAEAAERART